MFGIKRLNQRVDFWVRSMDRNQDTLEQKFDSYAKRLIILLEKVEVLSKEVSLLKKQIEKPPAKKRGRPRKQK